MGWSQTSTPDWLVTNLGKRTAGLQASGTELVGDSAAEPVDGTAQELT